jgi:hypothetical protein
MRRFLAVPVSAALAAAVAACGEPNSNAPPSGASGAVACDRTTLSRLLQTDTSGLMRQEVDAPDELKAGEGTSVVTYHDGAVPAVLVVTYFGETGKATDSYYLLRPTDYVVAHDEVRYSEPISEDRAPRIQSADRAEYFFCRDILLGGGDPTRSLQLSDVLRLLRDRFE